MIPHASNRECVFIFTHVILSMLFHSISYSEVWNQRALGKVCRSTIEVTTQSALKVHLIEAFIWKNDCTKNGSKGWLQCSNRVDRFTIKLERICKMKLGTVFNHLYSLNCFFRVFLIFFFFFLINSVDPVSYFFIFFLFEIESLWQKFITST